ncbi:MAG: Gfo/Idh/MocA family oxidoreductase, partial [Nanoarchaeota archaeon]
RVAVIGVGRIGKAHAYQLAKHDDLCTLVGMCRDKGDLACNDVYDWMVQRRNLPPQRVAALRHTTRTFVDHTAMIDTLKPDAVIIASPVEHHYEHAMYALEHGCHVLCEKPLCWDPRIGTHENRRNAEELFVFAQLKDRILAGGSQYAAIVHNDMPGIHHAAGLQRALDPRDVTYMKVRFGTASGCGGEELLVDLGDHLLTLLRGLCGPGSLILGTNPNRTQLLPFTEPTDYKLIVAGDYKQPSGSTVGVRFHLDATPMDPKKPAADENAAKQYLEITIGTKDNSYTVRKWDDAGPPYRFGLQSGERTSTIVNITDPLESCDTSFLRAVAGHDDPAITDQPIGNPHLLDAVNGMLCNMIQAYRIHKRKSN